MHLRISTPIKVALILHHLTIALKPVDKNGLGKSTKGDILRANNITKKLNLNANKLENFLRDISSSERLTKMELQAIQISVKQKNQNTTPLTRGTSVAPEKQNANKNQENDKNNESDAQEPLNIDTQDKSGNIMKESILQRHEIAKETPISKRLPIPKLKHE